jgi:hypothetical protein
LIGLTRTESDKHKDLNENEKFTLSLREGKSFSSSSSRGNFFLKGKSGVEGEKKENLKFDTLSLFEKFEKVFGISYDRQDLNLARDYNFLKKYKDIMFYINEFKVFTRSQLASLFNPDEKTIRKIILVLSNRKLIKSESWSGKSANTFGMVVYYTDDAKQENFDLALQEYYAADELRFKKQVQMAKMKEKPKKTPGEIEKEAYEKGLAQSKGHQKVREEKEINQTEVIDREIDIYEKLKQHILEIGQSKHKLFACSVCKNNQKMAKEIKNKLFN